MSERVEPEPPLQQVLYGVLVWQHAKWYRYYVDTDIIKTLRVIATIRAGGVKARFISGVIGKLPSAFT